jgi:predicted nuclease of predicted toxin-antitoxin system
MKLKLDENMGLRDARTLREAGLEVPTVADEGLCGAGDPEVIAAADREQRCLVTLDLGFANPLVFDPGSHYGIAVLRLPTRPCPEHVTQLLATLTVALREREIVGRLWIVELGRVREYQQERRGEI